MKKRTKLILISLICLTGIIIFYKINDNKSFDKDKLPSDWKKDAKSVVEVFINAMNTKDLDLINECIFKMDNYDYSYLGTPGVTQEWLDNIIYIKFIDAKEAPFKTVEGALKNGKKIYFKEGKVLDVEYKVKYWLDNQPDKSGINDQRYTLVKDENGDYKIIAGGY